MHIVRSLILFLIAASLPAQTFRGTISGVVTDASGASIAGASLKLDNAATGLTRAATSNGQGEYLFADLPVDLYSVTITQTRFESRKFDRVEVAVSRTTNLDVKPDLTQPTDILAVQELTSSIET